MRSWRRSPASTSSAAADEATLEAARREREFAELYAAHDRILAEAGSLDAGDVALVARRLLAERADARREIARRFRHVMVDELEDATLARFAVLAELAAENANLLCTLDDDQATRGPGARAASWFRDVHPEADVVVLDRSFRGGSEIADAARAVVASIPERLEKPGRAAESEQEAPVPLLALPQRARAGAGRRPRGRAPDRRRSRARRRSA